jgi:hypothetical protein
MDYYHYPKPYCREGESDAVVGLSVAVCLLPFCLGVWFLFLWAIGVIAP